MTVTMSTLTVLICAAAFAQSTPTQSDVRVSELMSRAVTVASIDPDDDEDFSDLQPLKRLIGDARLVVLGEQSHGDGAVFLAKARLVKFLHKEMGFDVLTWESGMYECREVDRALRNPEMPMDEIARLGIFPIWTASAQVRPTLEYVRATLATDRPIETAGFDHQFSGSDIAGRAVSLVAFFDKADPALLTAEMREDIIGGFAKFNERGENGVAKPESIQPLVAKWSALGKFMDEHRDALVKAHGVAEFDFTRRCVDDMVVSARSMLEFITSQAEQGRMKPSDNNTRDQRMGENLIWQVNERYKDRKVIAWMATMHAVHDVQNIKFGLGKGLYDGVINCGTVTHKVLGDGMYTIAFTSYDGKAGNVWKRAAPMELPKPQPGSLEDLCGQSGKNFLFIDFKYVPSDHWLRKRMVSRPLGYGEMTAEWPKQVDAMFYIRTMFPSTRENMLPEYAVTREP
jgi:erythromycin esterase